MEVDLAKLGRFVAEHFDLDQLQALCQELGISYDQLLGDSRSARAFDLVTLMRDQGQLSALLAAVAQARPDPFAPRDFEAKRQRERAGRGGAGWLMLLSGGVALALLAGFLFLLARRFALTPSPSATPTSGTQAAVTVPPARSRVASVPSPSPTVLTLTPSPIPATPTPSPTASPPPSPTSTATPSPTPSPTATSSPTPLPTATPFLSPLSPAWSYDAESRTLALTPGDTSLGRARLCTPLSTYHSLQALYLIEGVADALGLPLPAQARVTHSYPERLPDGPVVRTLELRRHPVESLTVSGTTLNFTGCDLIASEELRLSLGFPASLGEFNAPPRFDHGWVTIELLPAP